MASSKHVHELKEQLHAANAAGNVPETLRVLERLKTEVVPTADLLRETKIGISVTSLKKTAPRSVTDAAGALVRQWKEAIGEGGTQKERTGQGKDGPAAPEKKPTRLAPQPQRTSPTVVPNSSTSSASSPASASPPPHYASSPTSVKHSPSPTPFPPAPAAASPKPDRTAKEEGVRFFQPDSDKEEDSTAVVANKTRAACCELLYNILATDTDAETETIRSATVAVEAAAWKAFPPTARKDHKTVPNPAYKAKMRALAMSLKPAGCWREKVLSGEVGPAELVRMASKDFTTSSQQAEQDRLRAAQTRAVVSDPYYEGSYKEEQAWHSKGR
ncbi:hypothetical protein JCM10213_007482 [Rhodosporidiobolus nylandii]